MTRIANELRRFVAERAGECCEYCLLPRIAAYPPHEIDHIHAEKHGGGSTEERADLMRLGKLR
jgi:5-methylcytosine-specific restriction endonuclease McrA